MPYATATRPGSHWARLGLLLCDGIDSFSWIRLRCCDYSRVTRVRVLFTFIATRPALVALFGFVGGFHCVSPPFASSEGVSASGDRLQSDGVQDTHLLPHSLSAR